MVNMNSVVAVLFFVATAFAEYKHPLPTHVHSIVNTPGKQYELYLETTGSIHLADTDTNDAFIGLNIHNPDDSVVNKDDLNKFYWHEELKYAVPRFIKFIDDNNDKEIEKSELADDLKEKHIRVALIECHYLLSKGLKQSCLADQLLTYASLVLGEKDVGSFYKSLGGKDGKISQGEAEKLLESSNKNCHVTAEELGAYHGSDGVSFAEFTDYVTQETVMDDFRRCRDGKPNAETGEVKFKDACLLEELVEYTNDDLTEMDISVLYRAVNKDGKGGITKAEIKEMPGVAGKPNEAELVDRIVKLLDMSLTTASGKEEVIDYGEFRSYMRTATVQLQAERKCTEQIEDQKKELDCLFDLFVELVTTNHDAIWLVVPDIEQQIAFEIMDTDNDGEIKQSELNFKNDLADTRFIAEMDHDKGGYVCLEEWNEYMDIPHMVYGTADCLLHKTDENGRAKCYPKEVQDIIDNIRHFDDTFWHSWFKWYDSDKNDVIALADDNQLKGKCGSQDLEELFLDELGMGDRTVTLFEFEWYVKQQEIADRYDNLVNEGKKGDHSAFNAVLMAYIENDITEYDVQKFFDELDRNDDHEIDAKDFDAATLEKVTDLIKKIDDIAPHKDADKTVNFREFWLWLNSEKVSGQKPIVLVKDYFETHCTKVISGKDQQKKEIECYVDHFKNHNADIYK